MKYLLLASLILAIIITAGCLGDENSRIRRCGLVQYDIYEGFCCGITFHPASDRYFLSCCNGVTYKIDSQFCCNGVIYNSRTTQHCCNGNVESGGGTWSECGDQCYSMETQVCCRGVVHDKKPNQNCCGSAIYNISNQGCCNKETVFSMTSEHCCNGNVEPGGGTWTDCNGQCYNVDRQSCCVEEGETKSIHEGSRSCCIGRPSPIDGKYCQPLSGLYVSRSSSGYCVEAFPGHIWCYD